MNTLHPIMQQALAPFMPRYAMTSCSQCSQDTGPGDHGYSHCRDHDPRDMLLLDEDDIDPENPDEDVECGSCNGSGEGQYDGTRCMTCRGSGVIRDMDEDEY